MFFSFRMQNVNIVHLCCTADIDYTVSIRCGLELSSSTDLTLLVGSSLYAIGHAGSLVVGLFSHFILHWCAGIVQT